ncbi:hypothetical protein SRB5_47570 [Streptomyces sp. RB5]|uniref:Uncharacterized protein n=2 Tax=Streptomyces smaragdinus TaxID=2585196 RepID=A0A7K0CM76_9ACTN|nr:hypothetical protein [Streptomyces smaragdinus]
MAMVPLGALGANAAPASADAVTPLAAKAEKQVVQQLEANDKSTFWVTLKSEADLSRADVLTDKADRGAEVMRAKKATAKESQADVLAVAKAGGADARSFWISNTVKVTGDQAVAEKIAALPEVSMIEADDAVELPKPVKGSDQPSLDGVEWNIDAIHANDVWEQFGVHGEGIVVASVDSGVDFTHPAVAGKYRGKNADGTYSHDYNWFDPSGSCPTDDPCDNNDHGTHTMGTMVGDDGGANQIGVAPGAKWIAAKGCETSSCSRESLMAAGQWMVAPTDRQGNNPRPEMAPDVVNNSWGSTVYDPWYSDVVASWREAGIFPAFSNGNSGPGCNTSGSPGSYAMSYSSGAYDINGNIASFSSRGTGENGTIKPNIAAPGVDVRSSIPGGYDIFDGTSMASPHTAATVALLWSASPALQNDIEETEALLNRTATDTENLTCGGTAANNNVFGEGKLDALAAVQDAPRGPMGSLTGSITSGGDPVGGATVTLDGPLDRSVTTDANGGFSLPVLSVGEYAVSVSKYGYETATGSVTIVENETATIALSMTQAPSSTVSGTVSSEYGAAPGATVTFVGTPVSATTDAAGHYSVVIPNGDYTVTAAGTDRCVAGAETQVSVAADTTANLTLPLRTDSFGTACRTGNEAWVAADNPIGLAGDDAAKEVALPFSFPFYGGSYAKAFVSTNGVVSFGASSTAFSNVAIPAAAAPNAALYPFWDDQKITAPANVYTKVTGQAPNRKFLIEWRDITPLSNTVPFSYSAEISETGAVTYRYKDVPASDRHKGNSATIGVENATGTVALQYSLNTAVLPEGDSSISFRSTTTGVLWGKVTDANDGLPVAGATVTAGTATATTGADGVYVFQAPAGEQSVKIEAPAYQSVTRSVSITAGDITEAGASLATGAVAVKGGGEDGLAVVVPAGETRDRKLELTNTGSPTAYTVTGATDWLAVSPAEGSLDNGGKATLDLAIDATGLEAGVYDTDVVVASASGRSPEITVPVRVVVPAYRIALDSGAKDATAADALGDTWSADREYTAGSYGWVGNSATASAKGDIAATDDDQRFGTAREGMLEYRFDNVPDGTYTVELDFAELAGRTPGKRVFDVMAEGRVVEPNMDVALIAGQKTALSRTYTVTVTDGQLNLRFVAGTGKTLVNAVRVTERSDLG